MRRVLLVVFVLFFPGSIAANADTLSIENQFGTVTILSSGITSHGSQMTRFDRIEARRGHSLGQVNFGTGALVSGSVFSGGTFSSVGSYFDVIGQGAWMKKFRPLRHEKGKVAIFMGAFIGTIDWTLVSSEGFVRVYELTGEIRGQLWNGNTIRGTTAQIVYAHGKQGIIGNKGNINLGNTASNVPEPGSLGLLSLGLLMMGFFRRKRSAT